MKHPTASITIIEENSSPQYHGEYNRIYLYVEDGGDLESLLPFLLEAVSTYSYQLFCAEVIARHLITKNPSVLPVGQNVYDFMNKKESCKSDIRKVAFFKKVSFDYTLHYFKNCIDDSTITVRFKAFDLTKFNTSGNAEDIARCDVVLKYGLSKWDYILDAIIASREISSQYFYFNRVPASKKLEDSIYVTTFSEDMLVFIYDKCGACPCDTCLKRPTCIQTDHNLGIKRLTTDNCESKIEWSAKAMHAIFDFADVDDLLRKYVEGSVVEVLSEDCLPFYLAR